MDFYNEQHAYTLAQSAVIESDSDEESSWVMLTQEREIVKLPNEKIYYKVRSRMGLDLSTPKSLPSATPFSLKSDSGIVYITNHRVIYLPARPAENFKSFSAPVLNFEDTHITSSFFGPWSWTGLVRPTSGGGIPSDIPRLEIKLTFREGGHDAFREKFETMRERLAYAESLRQETGQEVPTGEDLPQYEPREDAPGPSGSAAPPPPLTGQTNPTQPTPDEPPPDYEEAQAQAVGMRLEERERQDADRQ